MKSTWSFESVRSVSIRSQASENLLGGETKSRGLERASEWSCKPRQHSESYRMTESSVRAARFCHNRRARKISSRIADSATQDRDD